MKKKSFLDLVFLSTGSCIFIIITIIVVYNFIEDASFIHQNKSLASSNEEIKNKDGDKSKQKAALEEREDSDIEDDKEVKSQPVKIEKQKAVKKEAATPQSKKINVEVVNYTGIERLTEEIRATLENAGYAVSAGNGQSLRRVTSLVIEHNDKHEGEKIRRILKIGKLTKDGDSDTRFDITVILGDDYNP